MRQKTMSSFVGDALKLAHRARQVCGWIILVVFGVVLSLIFWNSFKEESTPATQPTPSAWPAVSPTTQNVVDDR